MNLQHASHADAIALAYSRFSPKSLWDVSGGGGGQVSNLGAIADGVLVGKVMHAVEDGPLSIKAWGLWVYTDASTAEHQNEVVGHVLDVLDERLKWSGLRASLALAEMVFLLLDNAREQMRNGKTKHSNNEIARRIRVHRSEMHERGKWGKAKESIEAVFKELDAVLAERVNEAIANGKT